MPRVVADQGPAEPPSELDPATQPPKEPHLMSRNNAKYGLGKFLIDVLLVVLTGGLWLIWIFVREIRGLRQ